MRAQLKVGLLLALVLLLGVAWEPVYADPEVVAEVPVGSRPRFVAVNSLTSRIYVTNEGGGSVSIIDAQTNAVLGTVPVGSWPEGVAVNPVTNRIYVANHDSDDVSVIDGSNNTVIATIPVGNVPWDVAVDPTRNLVYVPNWNDATVSVIDGDTNSVIETVETGGTRLWAATVNPSANRVYVTDGGFDRLLILDRETDDIRSVDVGYEPIPVAFDPVSNRAYVGNWVGGSISVIDAETETAVLTIPVSAAGIAVNPATNRIFVSHYGEEVGPYEFSGEVVTIDGATNAVVATTPIGTIGDSNPFGVAVDPSTGLVYVPNYLQDYLNVIEDDRDDDGIRDSSDNCPVIANPGQTNTDGDQWGDACDYCPATATVWEVPLGDGDCDGFTTADEGYFGTDPSDACADGPAHDAWPLDINMDRGITVVGDVLNFRDRIGAEPGDPEWWQRLDLNTDGTITVAGDALLFRGIIGESCA